MFKRCAWIDKQCRPRSDCSWRTCMSENFRSLHYRHKSLWGERGGSVVECRTPEREVGGLKPIAAVLCPWARHFTPRKYWLITQEAVAPSWHDWKIVDWDVKPQHKQTNKSLFVSVSLTVPVIIYHKRFTGFVFFLNIYKYRFRAAM